jgi:hypothetical protein
MATRAEPVVIFADDTPAIFDYLVRRTSETIGRRVDRAASIAIGGVLNTDLHTITVKRGQAARLRNWTGLRTQGGAKIALSITTVQIERWLRGDVAVPQIALVYPVTVGSGGAVGPPLLSVGNRGLLFLSPIVAGVQKIVGLSEPAYQLAADERGMHTYVTTNYDDRGKPYTSDNTEMIEQLVAAVVWYNGFEQQPDEVRSQMLADALESANPHIFRHALRSLGETRDPSASLLLKNQLTSEDEEVRVRAMLGLWLLGDDQSAQAALERLFQLYGKYTWLARWGIERTLSAKGKPIATLYAPDPAETRGD